VRPVALLLVLLAACGEDADNRPHPPGGAGGALGGAGGSGGGTGVDAGGDGAASAFVGSVCVLTTLDPPATPSTLPCSQAALGARARVVWVETQAQVALGAGGTFSLPAHSGTVSGTLAFEPDPTDNAQPAVMHATVEPTVNLLLTLSQSLYTDVTDASVLAPQVDRGFVFAFVVDANGLRLPGVTASPTGYYDSGVGSTVLTVNPPTQADGVIAFPDIAPGSFGFTLSRAAHAALAISGLPIVANHRSGAFVRYP
jgi:hypothetical protein